MANVLKMEKQIAVIAGLPEGAGIRSLERQTDVHRDTIMRLGVRVGEVCTRLMDATIAGMTSRLWTVADLVEYGRTW